jgi:hypothetical protein
MGQGSIGVVGGAGYRTGIRGSKITREKIIKRMRSVRFLRFFVRFPNFVGVGLSAPIFCFTKVFPLNP